MSFFSNFPFLIIGDRLIRDITRTAQFEMNDNDLLFITINDGERADILSRKLYKSPEYDWTFYVINNITPDDWPLYSEEVDELVEEKEANPDAVAKYYDTNGNEVQRVIRKRFTDQNNIIQEFYEDGDGYGAISSDIIFSPSLITKSYRQLAHEENDLKRNIKAIRPENLQAFVNEFQSIINGVIK